MEPRVEPTRQPRDGQVHVRRTGTEVKIWVIDNGVEQCTTMSEWQARRIFGMLGTVLFGVDFGIDYGGPMVEPPEHQK